METTMSDLDAIRLGIQPRKTARDSSSRVTFAPDNTRNHVQKSRERRSRDKTGPSGGRCLKFIQSRSWIQPLVLVLVCLAAYRVDPGEHNPFHRYIFISYQIPDTTHGTTTYGKGPRDLAFVAFYTLVLTFTREFTMQELLRPLARAAGLSSRKRHASRQARFMEQMYTAVYFSVMGPVGLYVMRHYSAAAAAAAPGKWYFDTHAMYAGYPHTTHDGPFKAYYLVQAAYWAQQAVVLVLGLERPRKDFRELVAHHIVTLALIGLSWRFHFGFLGIAVYVTHDISDLSLAITKSLQYINSAFAVPSFGIFIRVWVYTRHYLNCRILWSLLNEFRTVGPYELDWDAQQYKCPLSNAVTLVLLSALQALNVFWLACIVRSAYRIVVHKVATDDRSEGENEDEVVEGGEEKKAR